MLLSIALMVKNESKYLKRCLESIQPIIRAIDSEIVIVDTGSTDNTVEIAKQFTDKVYFHEWTNNYSEMRNITLNYSTGDWFFQIDGDEIITNAEGIIQFFKSEQYRNYMTACVTLKNFMYSDCDEGATIFSAPRLFKKDQPFHYEGAIHEQPLVRTPLFIIDCTIIHYGYCKDDTNLLERKFKSYSNILENELNKNPENIYYLYQLSATYAANGDYVKAIEIVQNSVNIVKRDKYKIKQYIYVYAQLIKCYIHNNNFKEAEVMCEEVLREDDTFLDIYFYIATCQFNLYKYDDAIKNYSKYFQKLKKYDKFDIALNMSATLYTLHSFEGAYLNLAIIYYNTGNYNEALDYALRIKSDKLIKEAFKIVILTCLKLKYYDKLRSYYDVSLTGKEEEIKKEFFCILELSLLPLSEEERNNVYQLEFNWTKEYSVLNSVRISTEFSELVIEEVKSLKFNKLDSYYGDLIYYLIKNKVKLDTYLKDSSNDKFNSFVTHFTNKYKDATEYVYNYLKEYGFRTEDFNNARINKILASIAMLSNNLSDDKYREVFMGYIEYGIYNIENGYLKDSIKDNMLYIMKDSEDLFFMYIYKAREVSKDKAMYIKFLRNALEVYNPMKKGIEILLNEVRNEFDSRNNEMDQYKFKVKETIKGLIDLGNIDYAKKLIDEYENIVSNDIELFSMKAIIEMLSDNYLSAEEILKGGLELDSNNFDILFNLGFLYENKNNLFEAAKFYSIAKEKCNDIKMKNEIENILEHIKQVSNETYQ